MALHFTAKEYEKEKFTEEKNFTDHIKVNVFTGEIVNWFEYEAYK